MGPKKQIAKRLIYLLIVIGIVLPSVQSLIRRDFFQMHDYTHVARLAEMDLAIKNGHFPPRWSKNLGWGYGMPLFQFYAPLPYFLGEVFHLIGFNYLDSIKLVFGLAGWLAFGGMFLLARRFWGKLGAWLSAVVFVYAPYRAVDFYVRGALGELLAISMIPWALWAITRLFDDKKEDRGKIGWAAIFIGLFTLSHTILDLIGLPLLAIYAVVYGLITKADWKKYLSVGVSFGLGLGLASFFIVPGFLEKGFTGVDKLTMGYSHYSHHFLYFRQFLSGSWGYGGSVDGINDGMSFHLGKVHLWLSLAAVVLAAGFYAIKKKLDKRVGILVFSLLMAAGLAWLSTYHAKPVWDLIPMMAYIQFPWRLNSFLIVLISLVGGGVMFYLGKLLNKRLSLIVLTGLCLMVAGVNLKYFKPKGYISPVGLYSTDTTFIKEDMSQVIPDYIPRWVKTKPEEIALTDFKILAGEAKIAVKESKTHRLELTVEADESFELQLNRFYFPGWQVYQDGKKVDFGYEDNNGVIKLSLPAGVYNLSLIYKNTLIRTVADLVSAVSLALIVWFLVKRLRIKNCCCFRRQ